MTMRQRILSFLAGLLLGTVGAMALMANAHPPCGSEPGEQRCYEVYQCNNITGDCLWETICVRT